ncbi:alpha/beta hydrolase [Chitinophagaceae bacterium LB-8]|uniref:Alpha/beta hydrolase n=1 Tax=Paraflavisolibacter caeni TaxID=2982496 RepID=A0A9X3B8W5_9BACT|nr:alpha/beta hydrolase [Paraflavisolibacter caeni]MCU7551345.1 alpha/beta hydrolase [Paraflavisolibacter caeni]
MRVLKRLIIFCFLIIHAAFTWGQDGFIKGSPELAYWKIGNKKEVVIVLHGGPAAAHNYLRPEWDQLSKAAQVIYYDQRGCGKSEKATCYSWREHVEDLKRVINTVANGKRVILAGSSWGYRLALLYAYTYPEDVKAMILSGTVKWRGGVKEPKDCALYAPDTKWNPNDYREDTVIFSSFNFYQPPLKDSSQLKTGRKEKFFEGNNYSFQYTMNSLQEAPALQQLAKINTRILVFQAVGCQQNINKDAAHELIGVLPNLEVYPIKDACHDPWYTHTEEFFKKCNEFIKKVKA